MAAFLEDPRLRQRWNQISHNAEAATENAAAGIWTFQHTYITPCLGSVGDVFDSCTSMCFGDREERARRRRERERGAHRSLAEYSFDFYDDWYDDFNDDALDPNEGDMGDNGDARGSGSAGAGTVSSLFGRGFFGSWRGNRAEDWDRLLAGSGSRRGRHGQHDGDTGGDAGAGSDPDRTAHDDARGGGAGGEVVDQPRRKRGMSYSTRGLRRKLPEGEDPTVIPSTAPLGFLSRLPFKIGGTLRYKPSAANLRDHPNASADHLMRSQQGENEPLLGGGGDDYDYQSRGHGLPWQHDEHGTATMTLAPVSSSAPRPATTTGGDLEEISGAFGLTEDEAAAAGAAAGTGTIRKRSGTTGSGDTSDSYRSRGDLFPSDEEDDEDAVPLDDEFAVALDRVDDRSSARTRFSSSSSLAAATTPVKTKRKGKRRADTGASFASFASFGSPGSAGTGTSPVAVKKGVLSRSVSRTTMDSLPMSSPLSMASSMKKRISSLSLPVTNGDVGEVEVEAEEEQVEGLGEHEASAAPAAASGETIEGVRGLTAEELRDEEERVAREEDEAIARRREAAIRLARERGLEAGSKAAEDAEDKHEDPVGDPVGEAGDVAPINVSETIAVTSSRADAAGTPASPSATALNQKAQEAEFVPARLPRFS